MYELRGPESKRVSYAGTISTGRQNTHSGPAVPGNLRYRNAQFRDPRRKSEHQCTFRTVRSEIESTLNLRSLTPELKTLYQRGVGARRLGGALHPVVALRRLGARRLGLVGAQRLRCVAPRRGPLLEGCRGLLGLGQVRPA